MDVGFKMPSSFVKEELPEDVKLGDRVPLRVKRLQNPFGEMDVDSVSVDQFRKHQLAWDAIARKRENRELVNRESLECREWWIRGRRFRTRRFFTEEVSARRERKTVAARPRRHATNRRRHAVSSFVHE